MGGNNAYLGNNTTYQNGVPLFTEHLHLDVSPQMKYVPN